MGSEQDFFKYGFLGFEQTPYVRGSTPAYDLEDLNARYPTERANISTPSGGTDLADDLSDFFDFDAAEVEKVPSEPGNMPAPPKTSDFIDSGQSRNSPSFNRPSRTG